MKRFAEGKPAHAAATGRRQLVARALLLLILLLAFGLRLHQLEQQSMWSDEGLSLYRARRPLATVLANSITVDGVVTRDTNPPLYFLLLHGWRRLVGEELFLLRFAGVAAAMLAVPLLYVMARLLYSSRRVALPAALFMAISPFHIWQSQLLRNYGLLISLNLLSLYGLFRFIWDRGPRRWRWLPLWLLAALAGVYTHYFGFFIFALGLLILAGAYLARWRGAYGALLHRWWLWLLPLAGLLMLLPALRTALERFRAGRQVDFYDVPPLELMWRAADAFTLGMTPGAIHPGVWIVPGLILALLGLLHNWRRSCWATAVVLLYLFVPLALLMALSTINPLFNGPRHLLIGLPPFLLLAAAGAGAAGARPVASRSRTQLRLGLTLGALFLTIQIAWLQRQFNHPDFVRDDIRAAAHYLSQVAEAGDVVLLHDTLIKFVFDYYYDGAAPVMTLPPFGQIDEEEALATMQATGEQYRRVWFLTRPEPRTGFPRQRLVEWAQAHWYRINSVNFPWMWLPLQLQGYTADPLLAQLPQQATPLDAQFGDGLHLHGVSLPPSLQSAAALRATLYLSRQAPLPGNIAVSLRITDGAGHVWQQIDGPLWADYPPQEWPEDGLVRYDLMSRLRSGLQPGVYQVWLRLVDTQSGQPLPMGPDAVDLRLPDIAVTSTSCRRGELEPDFEARGAQFGTALVLRAHSRPEAAYRPGHLLSLDLLWCVRHAPPADYQLRLQLFDQNGNLVPGGESLAPLGRPDHPASTWQAGEQLLSKAQMGIPANAGDGVYHLRVALVGPAGDGATPVNAFLGGRSLRLVEIEVEGWPMETSLPPISIPLRADFGQPPLAELHGYDLPAGPLAPGSQVTVTSFWRAGAAGTDRNYYIFLHLGLAGEPPLAQADGPPLGGLRLTNSWREGEVLVDERTLPIPAGIPPGTYTLSYGFYDPITGERLPVFVDGVQQENNVLPVQQVTIAPE